MWDKKKDLQKRYDSTSNYYTGRYERIQKIKFGFFEEYLGESERILDVGCGTGLFFEDTGLRDKFFVGVDFSADMLNLARERNPDCYFVCADADNLPFSDEIFDLTVSFTLLQNLPDPTRTVEELFRVTEVGGQIIVTALRKKLSVREIGQIFGGGDVKIAKIGEISDSEDVFYVANKKGSGNLNRDG